MTTDLKDQTHPELWQQALERAGAIVDPAQGGEDSFDFLAIRGLIAVVDYAVLATGAQDGWDTTWAPVLYHFSASRLRDLVRSAIPASGEFAPLLPGDTPAQTWAWLERKWDNLDDQPPWAGTGLSRSVRPDLPEMATAVYWNTARDYVHHALERELGGLTRGTRIKVIDGVYSGLSGTIDGAGFDGFDAVPDEPVQINCYSVDLDGPNGFALLGLDQITIEGSNDPGQQGG